MLRSVVKYLCKFGEIRTNFQNIMCDWSETLSFKELTDFLSKNAKVPKKSR